MTKYINKYKKERRRTAEPFDGREQINGLPRETKWISNSQTPVKKHSLTQKKDDGDGNNDNDDNNNNNNNNNCTTNKMMMVTIIIMIIIIIIIIIIIKGWCIHIKQGCIQIKDQGRIIKQEKYTYML